MAEVRTEAEIRERIKRLRRRIDVVSERMYGAPQISHRMSVKLSEIRALLWASVDELRWALGETKDDAWGLGDEGDSVDVSGKT